MRTGQLIEGVGLIFRRSSWVIFGITLSSIFLFLPVETASHPEYAIQTNQPCEGCHIDPGGGGILNSTGEAFRTRGRRCSLARSNPFYPPDTLTPYGRGWYTYQRDSLQLGLYYYPG